MDEFVNKIEEYGLGLFSLYGPRIGEDEFYSIMREWRESNREQTERRRSILDLRELFQEWMIKVIDVGEFQEKFEFPTNVCKMPDFLFELTSVEMDELEMEFQLYSSVETWNLKAGKEIRENETYYEKNYKVYKLKKAFNPEQAVEEMAKLLKVQYQNITEDPNVKQKLKQFENELLLIFQKMTIKT